MPGWCTGGPAPRGGSSMGCAPSWTGTGSGPSHRPWAWTPVESGGERMSHEPSATTRPVTHPVLAGAVVRYVGEPIVGVLAESHAAAEDAAHRIEVQYDPLPAVTDVRAALAGTVRLHDTVEDNVLIRLSRGSGDVDAAF